MTPFAPSLLYSSKTAKNVRGCVYMGRGAVSVSI